MYDTGGSYSVCHPTTRDAEIAQRMSWPGHEIDPGAQHGRMAREQEHERVIVMRQPLTTEQAYRLFGTFLGLLPPFAYFERFLAERHGYEVVWAVLICVAMNVICGLVGRWFAGHLGRGVRDPAARSRLGFFFLVPAMALAWSVVTGGAGGALVLGVGAIFGAYVAAPVALVGFSAFAILHRLLSRGGMIEERHAWPLAFGIPLTIAAAIFSISQ